MRRPEQWAASGWAASPSLRTPPAAAVGSEGQPPPLPQLFTQHAAAWCWTSSRCDETWGEDSVATAARPNSGRQAGLPETTPVAPPLISRAAPPPAVSPEILPQLLRSEARAPLSMLDDDLSDGSDAASPQRVHQPVLAQHRPPLSSLRGQGLRQLVSTKSYKIEANVVSPPKKSLPKPGFPKMGSY